MMGLDTSAIGCVVGLIAGCILHSTGCVSYLVSGSCIWIAVC